MPDALEKMAAKDRLYWTSMIFWESGWQGVAGSEEGELRRWKTGVRGEPSGLLVSNGILL